MALSLQWCSHHKCTGTSARRILSVLHNMYLYNRGSSGQEKSRFYPISMIYCPGTYLTQTTHPLDKCNTKHNRSNNQAPSVWFQPFTLYRALILARSASFCVTWASSSCFSLYRNTATYIMGRYLYIIQCKTIELSTHSKMDTVQRSFAVVIIFPQLIVCM